jgi:hypothetical protein
LDRAEVFLTLDVDWAPDAAIDATASLLEEVGCKATWFVTHETPALARLRSRPDLFELGIHPNFLPGSSHGDDPEEILRHTLKIVPEARCARAHSAFQSGPVLKRLRDSQIELDCSIMLPGLPHAKVVGWEDGRTTLWRVPNFWSDDYEAEMREPNWGVDGRFAVPGVKVLIFHPIHIALNTRVMDDYARHKSGELELPPAQSADEIGRGGGGRRGAGSLFASLAGEIAGAGGGATMSTLIPGGAE